MSKASDLAKLFSAIGRNDVARAHSIASEIARAEADSGHHSAARLLLGSLQPNGNGTKGLLQYHSAEAIQIGGVADALVPTFSDETLDQVKLNKHGRRELDGVLREWTARDALSKNRLKRRNKILFYGPPGCGKSLTARAIGRELSLPVYTLRFDAIVGAFLGQTAQRLRQVFEFASATPCVLLIDEIDALGKRRGNPMDVGELDRIVISLLQELEHSEPKGLLIAASNIAESLDEALWRRFDLVLEFPKPRREELKLFAMEYASGRGLDASAKLLKAVKKSSTYADAVRVIEAEEREKILSNI